MATTKKGLSAVLNARAEGCGTETVVFAHGYGTDQSIWDKIVPLLSENYRLVMFDWPSSGTVNDQILYDTLKYSSLEGFADDLITLMCEMDLKAATFVGHSMSGMIGCIASVKKPDLFKRLILVGASPRYLNSDDYEGGFNNSDVEQLLLNIETNYENFASSFASSIADPINDLSVIKYEKCLKRMRPEVAHSLAKAIFYSDWREILDKVETPCTIIQTTNDSAVPLKVAHYMEKKIKGEVTLEIIDTIGHFPQLTAHLKFVERHWGCSHHHRVNFHRSVAEAGRDRDDRREEATRKHSLEGGSQSEDAQGTAQTAVELKICGWRPRRRGVWQRQGTEGTARAMGGTAAAITIQELRWLDSKTAVSHGAPSTTGRSFCRLSPSFFFAYDFLA
ncbi:Alpha/Beta hydrolase fold [Sesbania bispinosa]|nr:Alpha/Beta hydrolase fold [Sesbania bispinosa]